MSDETTLLPCPICGKKVSIARTDNEVGERWWFITRGTYRTTRCNCRLFLESEKFTCGWNDDYSLECRAKLIDKWNTRAELGSGTCHGDSDLSEWVCSSCQCWIPLGITPENVANVSEWRYCPHCGARVIKRAIKAVE